MIFPIFIRQNTFHYIKTNLRPMKKTLIAIAAAIILSGCCSDVKVIGISCGISSKGTNTLSDTYVEAIRKAGGIPVLIPAMSDSAQAAQTIALLDGILFSGGEDFDPNYYGESILNETVGINARRDTSDMLLAKEALKQKKPIMGICRGEQLMNVVLGGSLYQDIPSQVGETVKHSSGAMHKIGVEKGSVLYEIFQEDSITVNSYHHQAVKIPAPGIIVTARTADGIVEAYEAPGIIAFQFHPEKLLASGEDQWLQLFEYFIDII